MTPDELKAIRKAADLSQAEFGDKVGVSRLSVANWENGKYRMPNDLLDKLATAGLTSTATAAREADSAHKRFVKRLVEVYTQMRASGLDHAWIIHNLTVTQALSIPADAQAAIAAAFPDILTQTKD